MNKTREEEIRQKLRRLSSASMSSDTRARIIRQLKAWRVPNSKIEAAMKPEEVWRPKPKKKEKGIGRLDR